MPTSWVEFSLCRVRRIQVIKYADSKNHQEKKYKLSKKINSIFFGRKKTKNRNRITPIPLFSRLDVRARRTKKGTSAEKSRGCGRKERLGIPPPGLCDHLLSGGGLLPDATARAGSSARLP